MKNYNKIIPDILNLRFRSSEVQLEIGPSAVKFNSIFISRFTAMVCEDLR